MMYTIVAPVPEYLTTAIEPHRQKYDPAAELIPPHITLLKPFNFSGTSEDLYTHLQEVGDHQAPIKSSLAGWDVYTRKHHLLCLPLIAGRQEFISLRDHLLTGPLSPLAKQDRAYRPHIIFGRFSNQSALEDAKKVLAVFEPQFVFRVTHLELWQRGASKEPWQLEKRFGLKATVLSVPREKKPVRTLNELE